MGLDMSRLAGSVSVVLGLCLILISGCSHEDDLSSVRGRVCFKGQPLRGGSIVFTPNPDKGGCGELAVGEIASDGTFELKTGDRRGAVAGWHRVTIAAVEMSTDKTAGGLYSDVRPLLPRRYAVPDLSGLERQIKAGEENVFEFELE
jgi:hypothetical protein